MASIRKYELTKKDLVDSGYFVEEEKVYKQSNSNRWGHGVREIKQQIITRKHKYGINKNYIYVSLRIERLNRSRGQILVGLHNVIYAWYKGEVPLGYEVDHIDNNPFNNNIDNLELVTHAENMRRCPNKSNNQWYYIKGHNEESWDKRRQELNDERNNRKLRKELKPQYDLYIKILEDDIKKAKKSGDFKTWHELIDKRIKFGEFVNKYKEKYSRG